MSTLPGEVRRRAASIRVLVLDVDGVLTDGSIWYGARGEELKPFHVRDGFGMRLVRHEGVEVAVLSARRSDALERRLGDLAIEHAVLGSDDKIAGLERIVRAVGAEWAEVAHVGDDVLDLPVFRRVGLPVSVRDGHPLVRAEAAWVTEAPGGRGAVREVADGLLEARGRLKAACESFLEAATGRSGSPGA